MRTVMPPLLHQTIPRPRLSTLIRSVPPQLRRISTSQSGLVWPWPAPHFHLRTYRPTACARSKRPVIPHGTVMQAARWADTVKPAASSRMGQALYVGSWKCTCLPGTQTRTRTQPHTHASAPSRAPRWGMCVPGCARVRAVLPGCAVPGCASQDAMGRWPMPSTATGKSHRRGTGHGAMGMSPSTTPADWCSGSPWLLRVLKIAKGF